MRNEKFLKFDEKNIKKLLFYKKQSQYVIFGNFSLIFLIQKAQRFKVIFWLF